MGVPIENQGKPRSDEGGLEDVWRRESRRSLITATKSKKNIKYECDEMNECSMEDNM